MFHIRNIVVRNADNRRKKREKIKKMKLVEANDSKRLTGLWGGFTPVTISIAVDIIYIQLFGKEVKGV